MDNRSCSGYSEKLVLYHFGELDKAEAAEVAAHVLSCATCREELREISVLDGFSPVKPRQGEVNRAVEGVMKGISPVRIGLARRLIPAYIAVAAAVLAVFLTIYMPNMGGKVPQEQQQVAMAQADWEVLENLDVIGDIDVIVQMDKEGLDEIGPIRD